MEDSKNESQGREGRGQGPRERKGKVNQEAFEELDSELCKMPV